MSFFAKKNGKVSERYFECTLNIFKSEYDYIYNCVMEFENLETGGDLFGLWSNTGDPFVHYIIGPGQYVKRTSTSFFQDKEFLISAGNLLSQKYGIHHIGEWHSHHQMNLSEPSLGDIETIKAALYNPKYNRNSFLLVICNIKNKNVELNPYIFYKTDSENIEIKKCLFRIIDEYSPTRYVFDKNHKEYVYSPQIKYNTTDVYKYETTEYENEQQNNSENINNSFFKSADGKKYLKNIYDILKNNFDDVKIFNDDRGQIYFEVFFNDIIFLIYFPVKFPNEKPYIYPKVSYNEKFIEEINRKFKWNPKKPLEYIINCIESFIKSNKIGIEIR